MSVSFLRRQTYNRRHLLQSLPRTALGITAPSQEDDTQCDHRAIEHSRSYHATPSRQILPLVALGVGVVSVYSYRALKQMDDDWEEYYEKLEDYRRITGEDPEIASDVSSGAAAATRRGDDNMSSLFKGGTLAVDMGTSKLKLASKAPSSKPAIVVDREGARSTPSFVWINNDDVLVGRMAEGRLYDSKGGNVMRPSEILASDITTNEAEAIQQSIRMACSNALEQVLGGQSVTKNQSTPSPLFVLDESMAYSGAYNVRPVFTYRDDSSLTNFKQSLQSLTSPEGIALFVPEQLVSISNYDTLMTM